MVPSSSEWLSLFRTIATRWNKTEPTVNRRLGFEVVSRIFCKSSPGVCEFKMQKPICQLLLLVTKIWLMPTDIACVDKNYLYLSLQHVTINFKHISLSLHNPPSGFNYAIEIPSRYSFPASLDTKQAGANGGWVQKKRVTRNASFESESLQRLLVISVINLWEFR